MDKFTTSSEIGSSFQKRLLFSVIKGHNFFMMSSFFDFEIPLQIDLDLGSSVFFRYFAFKKFSSVYGESYSYEYHILKLPLSNFNFTISLRYGLGECFLIFCNELLSFQSLNSVSSIVKTFTFFILTCWMAPWMVPKGGGKVVNFSTTSSF